MKFKFDPNQQFQIDAVDSVVDIFEGQPKIQNVTIEVPAIKLQKGKQQKLIDDSVLGIYPNRLALSHEEVFANVAKIQEKNKIKNGQSDSLDFSVEMETGTGKTYVYLRTILELNKRYSWKKFIIIVPSVAIREGVIKTLNQTRDHFRDLYDNIPFRYYEYNSANISRVKHFAMSNNVEIMVMTMGAFNKDENVLYSTRDQMQGQEPISYIKKTSPVIILDEPQNMEGEATQEKLKEFNALCHLRYSATHRKLHNLMYQLTPYDAYQLGLVKRIEVFSIFDDDDNISGAYLNLIKVTSAKTVIKAQIEVLVKTDDTTFTKKKIIVKKGDDLSLKTNNPQYEGYVLEKLTVDAPEYNLKGEVKFKNGVAVKLGESTGEDKAEIFRQQISETIRLHFEKRAKLKEKNIKTLSLFFIDKVDNYVQEDGIIRQLFREEFNKLKKEFGQEKLNEKAAHKGYFAMRGNKYLEREQAIAENKEAYELIMKEKERLLSFEEPTEFVFTHSALKEGWDNPNIFNICTLRATTSQVRKRQEIGRGMRLCVNQDGERMFDKYSNLLSVIANESYSNYVGQLQSEFEEDGIYNPPPKPDSGRKKCLVKTKRGFNKDNNFQELWQRISKKTMYSVNVDSTSLVERCAKRIKALDLPKPQMKIERAVVNIDKKGVDARLVGEDSEDISGGKRLINCIDYIKDGTKLTARTAIAIIEKADNHKSLFNNPERFSYDAVRIIREELTKDFVAQISYELLPDTYDVGQFESIPTYKSKTEKVDNSIYDAIVCDSEVERKFALNLDHDERIKLFIKLPRWFKVDTPAGDYNPDWAIVTARIDTRGKESSEKIYFVIETKGDITNLREGERNKIESAKKHFEVIDVNYKEVDNYERFREMM